MKFRVFFLILLTFVGGFGLGLAAVEPYQVFINGNLSKVQVQQDKDTLLVPLTLPLAEESAEWTVTLQRNDKTHKVDVKMSTAKAKLRGLQDCYYCAGNGLCANDYPAGSGQNYSGITEGSCNGTGRCYHCSGTGKLGL
jgi:DnaJ-class molecular chaperone